MQQVPAGAETAITARARQPQARILADLQRSGTPIDITKYAQSISIQRALTTDVPDGVSLLTGYSAATVDLQLGGNPDDASEGGAWTWSPLNTDSPVWGEKQVGAPISVELGFSEDTMLPQLTGYVRSIDTQAAASSADMQAVDGSERLRKKVVLPPAVANYQSVVDYPELGIAAPMDIKGGLNAQGIVDWILRQNSVNASPGILSDTILSATLHGWANPDSGRLVGAYANGTPWSPHRTFPLAGYTAGRGSQLEYTPGKYGLALAGGQNACVVWNRTYVDAYTDYIVEAWINIPDPGTAGPRFAVALTWLTSNTASDTGVKNCWQVGIDALNRPVLGTGMSDDQANIVMTASTGTAVAAQGWTRFECHVQVIHGMPISATFRIGSTQQNLSRSAPWEAERTVKRALTVSLGGGMTGMASDGSGGSDTGCTIPVECVSVRQSRTGYYDTFTPDAKLDVSLNELNAVPYTGDSDDAWSTIQDIASAEAASAYFTESGLFRYANRNEGDQTSRVTLTSEQALKDFTITKAVDSVRNMITATAVAYAPQPAQWVWTTNDTIYVAPRQTTTVWADFGCTVLALSTTFIVVPTGGVTNGYSGYRACRTADGQGAAVEDLQITVTPFATSAKIDITNPGGYGCYLVCPDLNSAGAPYPETSVGRPILELWGVPVLAQGQTVDATSTTAVAPSDVVVTSSDAQSIDDYGEQTYEVPRTEWLQSQTVAQALTDTLLQGLRQPPLVISNVRIVADHRLQLRDRVTIVDNTGTALNQDLWVTGVTTTFSTAAGMEQSLTARPVTTSGGWILGNPQYSVLGETTVLGGT